MPVSCCKFWIYWVDVNTKFTTWHMTRWFIPYPFVITFIATDLWRSGLVPEYMPNWSTSLSVDFFLSLWGIVSSDLFVLVTLYFQLYDIARQYTNICSVWFPFVPFIFHLRCTAYSFLLVQNTLHLITGSGVQLIYMQQRRLKM